MSWLHHQGLAFVIGISATLFQPVRSGSHLYSAHLHTVRSGHGVEGLTDSRGSFPLGLPCPRLLYPYCITTWGVCQEVFEISFKGLFLLGAPLTPGVLWTPLDFSYIVPHIGWFVKGEFQISLKFFRPDTVSTASPIGRYIRASVCVPLLTMVVYHIHPQIAIGRMHKIGIFIFLIFVQLFS